MGNFEYFAGEGWTSFVNCANTQDNKVNIRSQVGRSKGTMMKEIEVHSGILEGLAIFEKVNYQYFIVVALQSKM